MKQTQQSLQDLLKQKQSELLFWDFMLFDMKLQFFALTSYIEFESLFAVLTNYNLKSVYQLSIRTSRYSNDDIARSTPAPKTLVIFGLTNFNLWCRMGGFFNLFLYFHRYPAQSGAAGIIVDHASIMP